MTRLGLPIAIIILTAGLAVAGPATTVPLVARRRRRHPSLTAGLAAVGLTVSGLVVAVLLVARRRCHPPLTLVYGLETRRWIPASQWKPEDWPG